MVTRNRGGDSPRSPGLIDVNAARASRFHFTNLKSLRFDSTTSESVQGPAMQDVGTFAKQFSVALWHKWTGAGPATYDGIANATAAWVSLGDGWSIYWQSSSTIKFFVNNYSGNAAVSSAVTASDWNFIVAVYDGTLGSEQIKIYTNGSLGAPDTLTADLTGQTNVVEVGKPANDVGGNLDWTVGNSDEFAIWDSPLTSDEITEMYNGGVAGFEYDNDSGLYTSSAGLRLWWRLGDDEDTDGADGIVDTSGNANHGTLSDITSANFENDVAGSGA